MLRLERIQRSDTKKALGIFPYENKLRELDLFSLEERWLREELITTFLYLKGTTKEVEALFLQGFTWKR